MDWSEFVDDASLDAFIEFTTHHGVTALVAYYLRDVDASSDVVTALKQKLHDSALNDAAYDLFRTNQLHVVLSACREQGIVPLVLKGAAMAQTHYPSPELRARSDADIFIAMGDIRRIQAVMQAQGYAVSGSIYKSHQFSCGRVTDSVLRMTFDVHWRISNSPLFARSITYEDAMAQSIAIDADGNRGLSPVHALLLACMHRAGNEEHDADRLIWLYDLHLLIAGMDAHEQLEFAGLAVETGVEDVCLQGIASSAECFQTTLNRQAMELLSASSGITDDAKHKNSSYLSLMLDDLKYLTSWRDRFGLLRELLLPSAGELLRKYQKRSALWLPWLYVRYLVGGMVKRVGRGKP